MFLDYIKYLRDKVVLNEKTKIDNNVQCSSRRHTIVHEGKEGNCRPNEQLQVEGKNEGE